MSITETQDVMDRFLAAMGADEDYAQLSAADRSRPGTTSWT